MNSSMKDGQSVNFNSTKIQLFLKKPADSTSEKANIPSLKGKFADKQEQTSLLADIKEDNQDSNQIIPR